ncbi:MAG: ATP-NAD kinase family protein [Desulfurococcales archaeon]|nr:ATP-NAD kinase family protein [Desulfurococcales archaeon]
MPARGGAAGSTLTLGPARLRVGVIVNPVAGMGGRLALKGTDGAALLEALARGARPVSPIRASRFLAGLDPRLVDRVYMPAGLMGSEAPGYPWRLEGRVSILDCVEPHKWPTSRLDTIACARAMLGLVDLLVFVGGDGTARDVLEAVGLQLPILGVPAGVKVFSGVFAVSPESAARLVARCATSGCPLEEAEIVDADEEEYRRGRLALRLHGYALTPKAPGLLQGAKEPTAPDDLEGIGLQVAEMVEECTLYILGPGSTVAWVARALGVEKTLLGVDAYHAGRLVGRDLDAGRLESLASSYDRVRLILTPVGGTGFLLGRGNQQITPAILRRAGRDGLIVVSAPSKLRGLHYRLLVDTGDPEVDSMLEGHVRVVVGYNRWAVARIVAAWRL